VEGDAPTGADRPRWIAASIVLAVVLALALGAVLGPRIAEADGAGAIQVGSAAVIQPADGWSAATVASPPGTDAVRLTRGSGSLTALAVEPFGGSPAQLLDAYATGVLPASVHGPMFGRPDQVVLRSGARAETVGYLAHAADGTPVEGVLVAVVGPTDGVVFDARAPQGQLGAAIDDVRSMIGGAEVT
jgi:hypothetical protein